MSNDNAPLPPLLQLLEHRMMASPQYQRAVKKYEQAQGQPLSVQRAPSIRKMKRLMAQEDRKLRAAQRRRELDG